MYHLDFSPPVEIEKNMEREIPLSLCIHRSIPQCKEMGIDRQFDAIGTTKEGIGQTKKE
jgi:adenylosuccinate synthase